MPARAAVGEGSVCHRPGQEAQAEHPVPGNHRPQLQRGTAHPLLASTSTRHMCFTTLSVFVQTRFHSSEPNSDAVLPRLPSDPLFDNWTTRASVVVARQSGLASAQSTAIQRPVACLLIHECSLCVTRSLCLCADFAGYRLTAADGQPQRGDASELGPRSGRRRRARPHRRAGQ